jgi:transposase
VLCFDEWGPLELRPIHGDHWAKRKHPLRLRATYKRLAGTEQFLGFYDVHQDCLAGTIHKRKTVRDILIAFKRVRKAYQRHMIMYIVMDNLPHHKSKRLLTYFSKNKIIPVCTPTYSSWLNLIESHFTGMKKFTLSVSDDSDHHARRKRIYRYVRWRNRQVGTQHDRLNQLLNH